jgi:hypothetical protein
VIKKTICINDCRLIYGVNSVIRDFNGRSRSIKDKCCFEIPVFKNKQNVIGLKLIASKNVVISVLAENKQLTKFKIIPEWKVYYFKTKPIKDVLKITLKYKAFEIEEWARVHGVSISDIEIECENGKESELKLDLNKRIEQLPMYVTWSTSQLETSKGNPDFPNFENSKKNSYNLYWGDIHIHSNNSACGHPLNKTIDENYKFARDVAKLDFAVITDHEYQTEKAWKEYCDKVEKYYKPGKFTTFLGFEWTSETYGHRNVYYKNNYKPLYNWWDTRSDTPPKLWKLLKSLKTPVISVPHHPPRMEHMVNPAYYNPELEPLVEIYSEWGNHEYYGAPIQMTDKTLPGLFVQDFLSKGYKFGFLGSSDGHLTNAGMSGLMGVYAKKLDRESIWDAFVNRRTYATTGAKIKLDFKLNGFPMGSIIKVDQYSMKHLFPLKISIGVEGTANIEKVEIIQNNFVIHKHDNWRYHGKTIATYHDLSANWELSSEKADFLSNYSRYYYLRVTQVDKHMAWSSPIWIDLTMNEDI